MGDFTVTVQKDSGSTAADALNEMQKQVNDLKDLVCAAKQFIDSHVADPDITNEMIRNYQEYNELLAKVEYLK